MVAVGLAWWIVGVGNNGEQGGGMTEGEGGGVGDVRGAEWVEDEVERLKGVGLEGAEVAGELKSLAMALRGMEPDEALAGVRSVIDSGADFETGMGFEIGSQGQLEGWPTLRVFLLAESGEISAAGAAELAKEILAEQGSADEWAVAMRNLGRAGGEDVLLRKSVEAMLENDAWRENASVGYLEAFDVIVHTRHTAMVPALLRQTGDAGNRGLRHASYLTLFRLAQQEPVVVLGELAKSGGGPVEMVAGLMAGADIRDGPQRAIIEAYLLDEGRGMDELGRFCGLFPSANEMVSNNLLTGNRVVDGAQLAVADAAALGVVDEWLADPRFSRVHGELGRTRERLKRFVKR